MKLTNNSSISSLHRLTSVTVKAQLHPTQIKATGGDQSHRHSSVLDLTNSHTIT